MPHISSVETALPPIRMSQSEVREFVSRHFSNSDLNIGRLATVYEHSGINERYFVVSPEWYFGERSFSEKNELYIEWCDRLGTAAANRCLAQAGLGPGEIDYIIFVSTTGLATPSMDARLINLLNMRSSVRRTPIWGLGCAGGAAGLSHAYHHLLGHPKERVLVVAVELCSLTFLQNDFSKSNFVATALFGDGAAAVLISGDEVNADGPLILGTQSTFWPDSLEIMGWNFHSQGMQVVFNRNIPQIVRSKAKENLESLLARFDLTLSDIDHLIFHPGGIKVIEAYEEALGLTPERTKVTRDILARYGNISSVSVLFVLHEHLKAGSARTGDYGLVTALGPGFCSESLLLRF